jgi:hypothetical protein
MGGVTPPYVVPELWFKGTVAVIGARLSDTLTLLKSVMQSNAISGRTAIIISAMNFLFIEVSPIVGQFVIMKDSGMVPVSLRILSRRKSS